MPASNPYSCFPISDFNALYRRPQINRQNQLVALCSNDNVLLLSAVSGQLLTFLPHDSPVSGSQFSPRSPCQVYTFTSAGVYTVFDVLDGVVLREIATTLNTVVYFQLLATRDKSDNERFLVVCQSAGRFDAFVAYDEGKQMVVDPLIRNVPSQPNLLVAHHNLDYVVYGERDQLMVYNHIKPNAKDRPVRHFLGGDRRVCCIAQHPVNHCVATGDSSGRVMLWYQFLATNPTKQIYHWHTLPVSDIVFSLHGESLYSGGAEAVLVKWSLHAHGNNNSEFLPRLGAPICSLSLSPTGSILMCALADNSVIVVECATFRVRNSIHGFVARPPSCHATDEFVSRLPNFLHQDVNGAAGTSTHGSLIAPGRSGQVQFYNPTSKMHITSVDVVGKNLPPEERPGQIGAMVLTEVSHCVTGPGWLVTAQLYVSNSDISIECLSELKFWRFCDLEKKFLLNTCVEWPHREEITCLLFLCRENNCHSVFSGARDGYVKLWTLSDVQDDSNEKSHWQCASVQSFRDLPVLAADVSADKSVLAVAFSNYLTVWDIGLRALKAFNNVTNNSDYHINFMVFGNGEALHYLYMATSNNLLLVWDVIKLKCVHQMSANVVCLTSDLNSDKSCFVDIAQRTVNLIEPIFSGARDVRFECEWARLPPSLKEKVSCCFVDDDVYLCDSPVKNLFCVSKRKNDENLHEIRLKRLNLKAFEHETPFAQLLQSVAIGERKTETVKTVPNLAKSATLLLAGPVSGLPDLELLAKSFVDQCLVRLNNTVLTVEKRLDTVPESMDVESPILTTVNRTDLRKLNLDLLV